MSSARVESIAPLVSPVQETDDAATIADRAACHALLNCLIKEFALPHSLLRYVRETDARVLPPKLRARSMHDAGVPLLIEMLDGTQFALLVDRADPLGSQYYLSEVFARRPDQCWRMLDLRSFAQRVVQSCSAMMGRWNQELLGQILASRDLTAGIVGHFTRRAVEPCTNYLRSEQCLWFGHPTHPASKARLWPQRLDEERYSPEFGVPSRLHVLEVPLDGLWAAGNGLSAQQVLQGFSDQSGARPGHALLSLHPIQAELCLRDARMQRLIAQGRVRDLGTRGFLAYPTASVRTLYVEGHDYFIKGSLSVRITNCVRKNAWYELESALVVDRILGSLTREHSHSTGGLHTVSEPGAVSWSPPDGLEEDRLWFREQTGAILRRNFCLAEGESRCLLAGTLFGRDLNLAPNVTGFFAEHTHAPRSADDLLEWFRRYQALLLRPVLSVFFNHGVVFEPHLQNTVVVHEQGRPVKLLLRDYEGVKLTAELGMRQVPDGTGARVRQSLEYTRAQGWNRVAYCLFVNNLSEAVLAMTHGRPRLAAAMWDIVREELREIRRELPEGAPELNELIAGGPIPCKTNLRVRLAAAADRHAGYVRLLSPWADRGS